MSNVKQYLHTVKSTRPEMLESGSTTSEEAKIIGQHIASVEGLAEEGVVIFFGRTQNS